MLRGRLGLETARIPHADRHGLLWLSRERFTVRDGTLRFERQGRRATVPVGERGIRHPFPVSINDIAGARLDGEPRRPAADGPPRHGIGRRGRGWGPLLHRPTADARHFGRGAAADAGVGGPGRGRITIARKMYALRLGVSAAPARHFGAAGRGRGPQEADLPPGRPTVRHHWRRRSYEPHRPPVGGPAQPGYQPRLGGRNVSGGVAGHGHRRHSPTGFIHEHSGEAFPLDIADLFRDTILLPAAFQSAGRSWTNPTLT